MIRYINQAMEMAAKQIRELQYQGKNVSFWDELYIYNALLFEAPAPDTPNFFSKITLEVPQILNWYNRMIIYRLQDWI